MDKNGNICGNNGVCTHGCCICYPGFSKKDCSWQAATTEPTNTTSTGSTSQSPSTTGLASSPKSAPSTTTIAIAVSVSGAAIVIVIISFLVVRRRKTKSYDYSKTRSVEVNNENPAPIDPKEIVDADFGKEHVLKSTDIILGPNILFNPWTDYSTRNWTWRVWRSFQGRDERNSCGHQTDAS